MTTANVEETVFGTPVYGNPEQDGFGNSINFLVPNTVEEKNEVNNILKPGKKETASKTTEIEEGGE